MKEGLKEWSDWEEEEEESNLVNQFTSTWINKTYDGLYDYYQSFTTGSVDDSGSCEIISQDHSIQIWFKVLAGKTFISFRFCSTSLSCYKVQTLKSVQSIKPSMFPS